MDQFQSALPGPLYHSKGCTDATDIFHDGFIFVDHESGYINIRNQVTFSSDEIVKARLLYERDAANYGVCIQAYHTDNGMFTSKDFINALIEKGQHIRFSGAGDAHQNGASECGIKTVIQTARTMLIHYAMFSIQGTITAVLWTMAIDHAV